MLRHARTTAVPNPRVRDASLASRSDRTTEAIRMVGGLIKVAAPATCAAPVFPKLRNAKAPGKLKVYPSAAKNDSTRRGCTQEIPSRRFSSRCMTVWASGRTRAVYQSVAKPVVNRGWAIPFAHERGRTAVARRAHVGRKERNAPLAGRAIYFGNRNPTRSYSCSVCAYQHRWVDFSDRLTAPLLEPQHLWRPWIHQEPLRVRSWLQYLLYCTVQKKGEVKHMIMCDSCSCDVTWTFILYIIHYCCTFCFCTEFQGYSIVMSFIYFLLILLPLILVIIYYSFIICHYSIFWQLFITVCGEFSTC